MNERQKYDQTFLNAFNVDDNSLGSDLIYNAIPEWDSIGHKLGSSVIDMHTIKPIDTREILNAVSETNRIVTIEEHTVIGGLGSAVSEFCLENASIPKSFMRIGINDTFSSIVGSQKYLRKKYKIDADAIVEAVKKFF